MLSLDIQRACLDTGSAKGAAAGFEVQIGYAGLAMAVRMDVDDPGFTGGHARACTIDAMRFQRQILMPGRGWSQRVLPLRFFIATFTGQIGAA